MRTITLKQSGVGRYDDVSPFIIADNSLELKISLPNFTGEFYFISENNGNKVKRLIPVDGNLTVDGLSAGELLASVKHYLKGELIKEYKIEPLILKEVDGKLSAEPEIIAVRREMQVMMKDKESLTDDLAEQRKELDELKNVAVALLRFAYADYCNNVYLGGESLEGFCEEFGFNLTDEEKEILGGTNKNED